jgi:hypothetical protein
MAVRVRRDRQINIEYPIESLVSGDSVILSWNTLMTTWAERKDDTSKENEQLEAMSRISSSYTLWIIAYPPSIFMPSTKMQIVELATGDIYDIENISELEKTVKEYLVLRCKQRQQR